MATIMEDGNCRDDSTCTVTFTDSQHSDRVGATQAQSAIARSRGDSAGVKHS